MAVFSVDDAPIVGASGHERRLGGVQVGFASRQLRFSLGDIGGGHLAGGITILCILEGALQDADVVLLHLEVGRIARHVHVGCRRREQYGFFHHPHRFARSGNLAFRLADGIGGALAIEKRLRAVEADCRWGRIPLNRERNAVRQAGRDWRQDLGRVGVLLGDRGGRRERGPVAG